LVETVRDNHPAKYGEFLRVLDDHSNQRYAIHMCSLIKSCTTICLSETTGCCRISVAVAASRVRELFRDSPGLVAGFRDAGGRPLDLSRRTSNFVSIFLTA
jgi:hypothetical protein